MNLILRTVSHDRIQKLNLLKEKGYNMSELDGWVNMAIKISKEVRAKLIKDATNKKTSMSCIVNNLIADYYKDKEL